MLGGGKQHHPANFGQAQRSLDIQRGKYRFDGDSVRLKFLDQRSQQGMNFAQALGKMLRTLARGAQRAET